MTEDNQLQVILTEQNVAKENAKILLEAFGAPFEEAGDILADYRRDDEGKLIVTDNTIIIASEDQIDLMAEARSKRLVLKNIRVQVEKKRKELGEDALRTRNAINSVAKFVKENIQPAEEYLEQQEKFAEVKAAERAAVVRAERIEKLAKYINDPSTYYNLDSMNDTQFVEALQSAKSVFEAKEAELKRIEDERITKEKADAEEQERIREENENLKAEAEARETHLKKEREAEEIRLATERAEQKKKLAAEQAKFEEERKKREALEAERQAKEKAEAETKAASDEAERQALLAPDKDKLLTFSNALEVIRKEKLPAVKTKQAQDVINLIDEMLTKMRNIIEQKAGEL